MPPVHEAGIPPAFATKPTPLPYLEALAAGLPPKVRHIDAIKFRYLKVRRQNSASPLSVAVRRPVPDQDIAMCVARQGFVSGSVIDPEDTGNALSDC